MACIRETLPQTRANPRGGSVDSFAVKSFEPAYPAEQKRQLMSVVRRGFSDRESH
jgi:hypothetical protein